MAIPNTTAKNVLRILACGKPFYAADLGMKGGDVTSLVANNFIVPTGNSRQEIITLDGWSRETNSICKVSKAVIAKEWRFATSDEIHPVLEYLRVNWLARAIADAQEIIELAQSIGIEVV